MYSCFKNYLAPSDIFTPTSFMMLMEFPPEVLSVELKSFYVDVSILLNSNQFQAAHTSPKAQNTNTKVRVPVNERGATPSGIDPVRVSMDILIIRN